MSEELIQQLDPKRDYGVRTYEDVVREVREGKLILKEGPTHQPLINDTRGLAVKGTGTWKIQQPSEPRIHTKAVFLERAHSDFEAVLHWFALHARRAMGLAFCDPPMAGD